MSGALAIAAVTATLRDLLTDGLLDHDLSAVGSVTVTALPPDRVATGQNEPNQLNLFLYQVTPNIGWRNEGLPSRDENGRRLSNPPLALDLHYIMTAYGSQDLNAEVLLGYGMQLLHETPLLSRAQLRTVLGGVSPVDGSILPPLFGNLSALDLADQVELIKITPVTLSTEDLSKMWTAMQARYRPTMAYLVSVVLIQATGPVRAAEPVLKRGGDDRGPVALASGFPSLSGARPALSERLPALRLGDDLLLSGSGFDAEGAVTAVFRNTREDFSIELAPGPAISSEQLPLHLPSIAQDAEAMNVWAAGVYSLSLRVVRPNLPAWTSNGVPIALAPLITVSPTSAAPGDLALTVTCTPRLRPGQVAHTSLIFGSGTIAPATVTTPADAHQPTTLTFTVPDVPAGDYVVRLRVDGVDSLPIAVAGLPAKLDFDPQQKVKVA